MASALCSIPTTSSTVTMSCGSIKTAVNSCQVHQGVGSQLASDNCTCTCPSTKAAHLGVGDVSLSCRQCQYAEATAQYSATMATLTAEQEMNRAHRLHLIDQRVCLASQPGFAPSVTEAKKAIAEQVAVLENVSRDLAGHVALAKTLLQMQIAAMDAQTSDNVMCSKSLMTPVQMQRVFATGKRLSLACYEDGLGTTALLAVMRTHAVADALLKELGDEVAAKGKKQIAGLLADAFLKELGDELVAKGVPVSQAMPGVCQTVW